MANSDYPKEYVRVYRDSDGGLATDRRTADSGEAETSLKAGGYHPLADLLYTAPPQEYPAWVYHEDGRAQQVNSEAEMAALGGGWHDTPADMNRTFIAADDPQTGTNKGLLTKVKVDRPTVHAAGQPVIIDAAGEASVLAPAGSAAAADDEKKGKK